MTEPRRVCGRVFARRAAPVSDSFESLPKAVYLQGVIQIFESENNWVNKLHRYFRKNRGCRFIVSAGEAIKPVRVGDIEKMECHARSYRTFVRLVHCLKQAKMESVLFEEEQDILAGWRFSLKVKNDEQAAAIISSVWR